MIQLVESDESMRVASCLLLSLCDGFYFGPKTTQLPPEHPDRIRDDTHARHFRFDDVFQGAIKAHHKIRKWMIIHLFNQRILDQYLAVTLIHSFTTNISVMTRPRAKIFFCYYGAHRTVIFSKNLHFINSICTYSRCLLSLLASFPSGV